MATEFDDSEHFALFKGPGALRSGNSFEVRWSEITLAALRAAGVLSNLVDGLAPPATDKLWLDKNTDPATLRAWDATGLSWVPMTSDRLFARAAVVPLMVTGGTGNAVVVSQPSPFRSDSLYVITPAAQNSGAVTIQVSGAGTYPVTYANGWPLDGAEFVTGRQSVLLFDGIAFRVLFQVSDLNSAVVEAQAAAADAEADRIAAEAAAQAAEDAAASVIAGWASAIHNAPLKASPSLADEFGFADSGDSWNIKKQTFARLQEVFGVPIGTTIMVQGNGNTPPPGFLLHNGASVTSAYPQLRAYLLANGANVDGNGNPIIEDMGGYFPRGWRVGQVVDSGRVFGSTQADDFKAHKHIEGFGGGAAGTGRYGNVETGNSQASDYTSATSFTTGGYTSTEGGTETRPVNKTFTFWIKAYAADQVPGSADFAALANNVQGLQARTTSLENYGRIMALVNFNGTGTVSIRYSKNVSSVADNGTGDYTVNFITPMPDANFIMAGTGSGESEGIGGGTPRQGPAFSTSSNTTTSCRVRTGYDNGALYDWPTVGLAFIR